MTDSEAAIFQARLAEAIALHQRGDLSEAENIYGQILGRQPNHFDALHLLGVLALQTGRPLLGVEMIGKAVAVNPDFPPAHVNLGSGYYELKQHERALASYQRAIALKPSSADAHLGAANALKDLKRPKEALVRCEKAVSLKPGYAEAWLSRGTLLMDMGEAAEALTSFQKAIALKPGYAEAILSSGNALTALGRPGEALDCYGEAIARKPDYAEAHCNRGIALAEMKRSADALASHDKAIALKPDYAEAHFGRANALMDMKQPAEALASYERAIHLKPDYAEAHSNRGLSLLDLKRFNEALASCERAILSKPDSAEAHLAMGIVQTNIKEPLKALEDFDRAIALKPDYAEGFTNRAICLIDLKRPGEALASCERAIALNAGRAEAHVSCANALADLKRFDEALASLDQAIALNPGLVNAWLSRGTILRKLERHDEAALAYEKVLELDPLHPFMKGVVLHQKTICCDWEGLDALVQDIEHDIAAGKMSADPFGWQGVARSQQSLQACARIYNRERFPLRRATPAHFADKEKIRVGYLSGEFRTQATSLLLVGVLEQHDREQFDIIAFDNGWDDHSETRQRIERAVPLIDIRGLDDDRAAAAVADKGIDILVDLNGYFGEERTSVFARRPASIQVNYLGFPGTLGASYIDYIIADRHVIPPPDRQFYDEKTVYLPNSYQANDNKRPIAERAFARTALGLPDKGFVFCCFNNNYKILPDVFAAWMRILGRTPGSVLWLLEDNPTASANLRKEAGRRGVDAQRLIFARRMPPADHLARHRCADLFLDTLPYNAHTTASDALWAGLPLLTCRGDTFAGRVAASLLDAIGLPELIAENLADYERLAIEIAADPEKLSGIKQKLAANRLTAPLFDTALFTGHLEAAYRAMVQRRQGRLAPDHIEVSSVPEFGEAGSRNEIQGKRGRASVSAVVIIPTTGDEKVVRAIESVVKQSIAVKPLVVIDGPEFSEAWARSEAKLREKNGDDANCSAYQTMLLPDNTGRGGFYGHRIYAAIPHLVNEDYVFFLDQDNWFEPDHVESLIALMRKEPELAFAYSLRNIVDKDGNFLARDNCESLGKWPVWNDAGLFHVDTSAYCFRREFLAKVCGLWHGGYGQDRKFFSRVKSNIPDSQYETSGKYTLNYRLDGNPGSAAAEFFLQGNRVNGEKYASGPQGVFPWVK